MQQDRLLDVKDDEPPATGGTVIDGTLRRAMARDQSAFGALYEAHVERIHRHVRYRVTDPNTAEDITAQVFLRAWQAIDRYRPVEGRPFLAWLFTIANNLIVDHHRRGGRVTTGIDPARHAATTENPEEAAVNADLQAQLAAAIRRLKPEHQLIVSLRLIEDMEYEDIARVMNKKPGALRVTLFRALAALRDDLSKRGIRP